MRVQAEASILWFGVLATACTIHTAGPSAPTTPPPGVVSEAPATGAVGGPATACVDPGERDFPDLLDSPTPIAPTSTTIGCHDQEQVDNDLFLVTAPAGRGGTVIAYQTEGFGGESPDLEILDANRKRLLQDRGERNKGSDGWVHLAGGTSVYFRLTQRNRDARMYQLVLKATPAVDDGANTSFETALPLVAGQPYTGLLAVPANDTTGGEDWFSVEVGKPTTLHLTADAPQGAGARIDVYDAQKKQVRGGDGQRGERYTLDAEIRKPGTYYVRVKQHFGEKPADREAVPVYLTRAYTLTLTP